MLREKIGKMIRAFRLCFGLYLLFAFFASVLYFIENGVLDYTFQIVIVTGILGISGGILYICSDRFEINQYYRFMAFLISASLLSHFILQGARDRKDILIFVGVYVLDIIIAIIAALIFCSKIVIHSVIIKIVMKAMGKLLGILLIIILCIGRGLTGRRGALFLDHISNNKNFFIWILLMIISFIFLFITVFYSIIDIIKQKDK